MLGPRLANDELFGLEVDVELVGEVGREDVWHARFACQVPWVPFDVVRGLPCDLLPVITLRRLILTIDLVNVDSVVDCSDEVIDDFHKLSGVAAEVETLAR